MQHQINLLNTTIQVD